MSDASGDFFNPEGWYVYSVGVQPGSDASVWNLIVQMDEGREEKRSQIWFTPSFPDVEPTIALDTHTWIGGFWASPAGRLYACDGLRLWTVTDGTVAQQTMTDPDRLLLKARGLDEEAVFLFGEKGLVLQRRGDGWDDVSIPEGPTVMDVAGFSPGLIYACGPGGGFFRREGGTWTAIDLGTNAEIRRLVVRDDGAVFGCGAGATAFRYAGGEATFFEAPPGRDYYGIARYRGDVYFGAGGEGVDRLDEPEIVSIKPNIYGQRLAVNERYLWSCGGNSIYRFDGTGWLRKDFI